MRPLRNCDFCDADAAGTFEVLPRDLEPTPTEDEQRRVVLCAECKDRLEVLLEPLLARAAGGGGEEGSATATTGATDAKTERARTDRDSSGTDDPARSERAGSRSGSDSPPELEAARPVETETTRTETRSADDGTADSSEDPTPDATADSSAKEEITFGDDGIPERSATGTDAETGVEADAGEKTRARGSDGSESGETKASASASESASTSETSATSETSGTSDEESTPTRPSRAYAKVVRLLRNRDFPVKRSEAEALAAGAYDLESDEVEAIVDHAIEQGEFEEHRGKLRRP
ncbi:hypothetical protein SAMN05444422_10576 [Halobiforma haloterrestris]|uniref:Uncharacterized protein n=1 Tax=Natronobacterium haloterrestre TaxID=148448 RepID=A0A1I1GWQ2_NATHA|nr:hypothetical protein [Halobiforma haloterrestris]SFC16269.1 hypothetical protein SAMN05444422_10576 [Halobiforma haloterrestris]